MVKIPELPGSYHAGDVVNGFVLTERGHWIPLAEAPGRGARPLRYLDPQVSTLRAADSPSQLANRGRAPMQSPSGGSAPGHLPRVQAHPSASRPTPGPPVPRAARRSTLSRVFMILLVTFVIVRVIAAIAGAAAAPGAGAPDDAPHGVVAVALPGSSTPR